jgi:hypothetical protein
MAKSREWLAPLTGVLFVVVLIVSFVVQGGPPDAKDHSAGEIVKYYVDHKDSLEFGAMLSGVAATAFVFFFAYVRKVLRAAEGEGGVLSLVAPIGAAMVAVGAAIDATILFAIAEAAKKLDPTAVQALQALWDNDFLPLAVGLQLVLLSCGISIVRHGALPRWLGWVAIVLGVVAVTPIGWAAFIGGLLWVLVVSVLLTLRARAPEAPA